MFIKPDNCRIKLYRQKDNISYVYKLARGQVLEILKILLLLVYQIDQSAFQEGK